MLQAMFGTHMQSYGKYQVVVWQYYDGHCLLFWHPKRGDDHDYDGYGHGHDHDCVLLHGKEPERISGIECS